MIWALRVCLGLVILAYAAWLGLPVWQGASSVIQAWDVLVNDDTIQAQAAAASMLAIIVLYAGSALATASGLTWAPGLFFSGFVGEIGLRLAVASGLTEPTAPALDLATRAEAVLRPLGLIVETTPVTTAALLSLGLCILVTGVWRGQKGDALTRVWTRQRPVWA